MLDGEMLICLPSWHGPVLLLLWPDIPPDPGGILPGFGLVYLLLSSILPVSGRGLLYVGSIPCGFSSFCVW